MNNRQQLQDTLVTIQAEIDKVAGLINETPPNIHHELLTIVQWLQAVREPITDAQQLLNGFRVEHTTIKVAEVKNIQPNIPSRAVQPSRNWPTTICKICKASVYQHDLEAHLIRIHHQAAPLVLPPKPKKQPKTPQTSKSLSPSAIAAPTASAKRQGAISAPASAAGSPATSTKEYEICPVCKDRVRQDRLKKHLSKVHPQASLLLVSPPLGANQTEQRHPADTKKSKTRKNSSVTAKSQAYLPTTENGNELSLEALDQSYRDRRDGGKELSQARRDHGQFGSMPVYDDYSDESYS